MSKQLVNLRLRSSRNKKKVTFFLDYLDERNRRIRISLGHADKRKAEIQRLHKEQELQMGSSLPHSMRLKSFLKDSLERTGDQIKQSTCNEYEVAMECFIQTVGNIDFQKITLDHAELFRQICLDDGNRPATVAKKLRHLKALFQLAVKRRQLDENPFRYIQMPKSEKKKVNIYTLDECQRILKTCREYRSRAGVKWDLLIMTALVTAMRKGELLNSTLRDIDFEKQTIEVAPKEDTDQTWIWQIKDNERRILPLTDDVTNLLIEHVSQLPEGYPYVFVPPARYDHIQQLRRQGKWSYCDARLKVVNNFTRQFQKILKKAGVPSGQFHDIRRTAISNWLVNGMSEHDVMNLAGHSDFATTHQFYLAVADDLVDRARQVSTVTLGQNLAHIWHTPYFSTGTKKAANHN